jgi:putative CocE/NonD family hydrolase
VAGSCASAATLAAILPWEGASDWYREVSYHGGILSNFFARQWSSNQIAPNAHGNGRTPYRDPDTADATTGTPLAEYFLSANVAARTGRPLEDEAYKQVTPILSRIKVPLLSAGNWGGMGLHGRGNIEGYLQADSAHKWLEMHSGTHHGKFYSDAGLALQKKFFDHYLKGVENGWEKVPPITIAVRNPSGELVREEKEWPLARTQWTKYYLDAANSGIARRPADTGPVRDVLGNEDRACPLDDTDARRHRVHRTAGRASLDFIEHD